MKSLLIFANFLRELICNGCGIEDINEGGCGFFAERCVRFLKGLSIDAEIHIFDNDGDTFEAVRNNSIARNGCSHVMVFIPSLQVWLDGAGCYPDPDRWANYERIQISPELLRLWNRADNQRKGLALNRGLVWNSDWDRRQIKKINKFFSTLKKAA